MKVKSFSKFIKSCMPKDRAPLEKRLENPDSDGDWGPDSVWKQKQMGSNGYRTNGDGGSSSTHTPTEEPLVHLTLVLDGSASMQGSPLAAVSRGVRTLLRFLQPQDLVTIWMFDGNVTRTAHCEAQYFTNQTRALRAPNSKAAANDKVWLYDAIVAAVEDLETQGQRPGVLKPLIVLSDTHMEYGRADGFEAQSALLWSEVAHLYPILIAAGDNEMFAGVKQTRTREVVVDGTEDSDLYDAFQVAGEHLQGILREAVEEAERAREDLVNTPVFSSMETTEL